MGPTQATQAVTIHRSPAWLGIIAGMLAGLVIGTALTLGAVLATGRLDLGSGASADSAAAPISAATLYATHVLREHASEIAGVAGGTVATAPVVSTTAAEQYLAHFQREHGSDMAPTTQAAALQQHVQRENRSDAGVPSVVLLQEHLLREYRSDLTAP
jgi:hypothetical protein